MPKDHDSLKVKIAEALSQYDKRTLPLLAATKRSRSARARELSTLKDPHKLFSEVKQLKSESIANLDGLLSEFVSNCEKNGARVLLATSGRDVIDYIAELAKRRNAKLIGKAKSLTTEEIELNKQLEEQVEGLKVVETDLGERIIQLAGEKPFHLVFPAVHKTQKEVAELFSKSFALEVADDLDEIMKTIRKELRPVFLEEDLGITGANVAVAESGTVVIETNEGNARLVSACPDVHVVVVGMEKIVPTWEDALKLMVAHPLSATGTRLTNYVSMISGRRPLEGHPERELHVIILDNGRKKMREDPWFREALSCIRCGACMNVCPTYGVVGGHTFGYIYPGPIGIPWTEEVHGLDRASEFAHLCIACGLCREICPADIDIPMMIAKVKEKDVEENGQLLVNKILSQSDRFAKLASATAPLSNWIIQNGISRRFMDRFLGIDRRRKLPHFERQTFEKRFQKQNGNPIKNPLAKVVYFVDIYANYNNPKIGEMALRLLRENRIEVILPSRPLSSGMPYVSYGELRAATKIARDNIDVLSGLVADGYDVIATEPTATFCLKEVYPKLLNFSKASKEVAEHSFEFFQYIANVKGAVPKIGGAMARNVDPLGQGRKAPAVGGKQRIGFHIPCHQRALSAGSYTIEALSREGYDVRVIETGTCCGMAGTFGLKKGELGYELSNAVGRPLFDLFNNNDTIELIATESSVCTEQLLDGTKYKVVHPLELIFGGRP